ncbi:hypothetical protein LguiA_031741 [Lonicera macranthoides]
MINFVVFSIFTLESFMTFFSTNITFCFSFKSRALSLQILIVMLVMFAKITTRFARTPFYNIDFGLKFL